ncbi:hypothetical protein FRB95_000622 [Tulasnella sp. JGI-2019a]|nr:hypothetical protein FRB95_000622 [Tulasnella sp. JGI-2019a]
MTSSSSSIAITTSILSTTRTNTISDSDSSSSRAKRARSSNIDFASAQSSTPIVRFKLVKQMASSLASSSSSTPARQHSRHKSHPFANLTFTALHELPPSSSSGDTGLRHGHGSSSSLSNIPHTTTATTTTQSADAGSGSGVRPRTRARSTTHVPSAAIQHSADQPHPHTHRATPSITTRTSSSKLRRATGSGSASAPSSPRSTSPTGNWYFTPSATPIVLPTPSTSPRPRKRSLGARSVPSSPGRTASLSPVNSYFSPKQLERTASVAKGLQRTAGVGATSSSSATIHGLTRASASTGAMSSSYPRRGSGSTMAVDALGLQSHRSSAYDQAPKYSSYDSSEDESDEHAMVMVGRRSTRSKRLDQTSRSRNHSFASLKKRASMSGADLSPEYNRGSGLALRGRAAATSMVMETETDGEFLCPLPTSRITSSQQQHRPSPVIFRWLAIIPPIFAALFHLVRLIKPAAPSPQSGGVAIGRADHFVCILWTLIVAYQSLSFTTGLLHRWRFYYPLLSVIIRLLALQAGICWPLMQLTLRLFDHDKRPLLCWTVIGTTTCVTKALQMWATSNLRGGIDDDAAQGKKSHGKRTRPGSPAFGGSGENALLLDGAFGSLTTQQPSWRDRGLDILQSAADLLVPGGAADVIPPRTPQSQDDDDHLHTDLDHVRMTTRTMTTMKRGRRWDWQKMYRKCVLPAAVVYAVMAWSLLLDRGLGKGPC